MMNVGRLLFQDNYPDVSHNLKLSNLAAGCIQAFPPNCQNSRLQKGWHKAGTLPGGIDHWVRAPVSNAS